MNEQTQLHNEHVNVYVMLNSEWAEPLDSDDYIYVAPADEFDMPIPF